MKELGHTDVLSNFKALGFSGRYCSVFRQNSPVAVVEGL